MVEPRRRAALAGDRRPASCDLLDNDLSADELYFKHYSVDYSCIADGDADGDGLTTATRSTTRGRTRGTLILMGTSSSDGVELNVLGTNPLDTDSDDDSVLDGDEDPDQDGLSNAAEVNLYGTDPTDGHRCDQLSDGEESPTGRIPGWRTRTVMDCSTVKTWSSLRKPSSFAGLVLLATRAGHAKRDTLPAQRRSKESCSQAMLTRLSKSWGPSASHVDGCGAMPDGNDWVRNCVDQIKIRALVDLLIANLTA
jgi:hypothetical protein